MTSTAIGARFPLLFTFRDTLFGNGFVVEVCASNGRVLCANEADGVWMYGVNPGGMSAHGVDAATARQEFNATFSRILKELAQETRSFDEFKQVVAEFFEDTNKGNEAEWSEAVQRVRAGQLQMNDLASVPAESPRSLSVEVKRRVSALDNEAELKPALAA